MHLRRAAIRQTPTPILQPWAARVVVVSMQAVCVSAQNERDDAFAKGGVGRNHYYEGVMRYLLDGLGVALDRRDGVQRDRERPLLGISALDSDGSGHTRPSLVRLHFGEYFRLTHVGE